MIETWATTLITFLIGYAVGYYSKSPDKVTDLKDNARLKMRRAHRKATGKRIGAITKLSAQEERIRNNPVLKGEEEEMTKVLDDLL